MMQLGKAFPDSLTKGHERRPHREDDEYGNGERSC